MESLISSGKSFSRNVMYMIQSSFLVLVRIYSKFMLAGSIIAIHSCLLNSDNHSFNPLRHFINIAEITVYGNGLALFLKKSSQSSYNDYLEEKHLSIHQSEFGKTTDITITT